MSDQTMIREDGSEVVLIHFVYQSGKRFVIACAPGLEDFSRGQDRPPPWQRPAAWRRSDDARAVTCPLCKETAEYEAAQAVIAATNSRRSVSL